MKLENNRTCEICGKLRTQHRGSDACSKIRQQQKGVSGKPPKAPAKGNRHTSSQADSFIRLIHKLDGR